MLSTMEFVNTYRLFVTYCKLTSVPEITQTFLRRALHVYRRNYGSGQAGALLKSLGFRDSRGFHLPDVCGRRAELINVDEK
jgi:hypothetical protein